MCVEDQDEDVEEEEEFHEVEEEKHKTSQESVGGSCDRKASTASQKDKQQKTSEINDEPSKPIEIVGSLTTEGNKSNDENLGSPKTIQSEPSESLPASSQTTTATADANPAATNDPKCEDVVANDGADSRVDDDKNVDWANIMLSSNKSGDSGATEDSSSSGEQSSGEEAKSTACGDKVDGIVAEIQTMKIEDVDKVSSLVDEPDANSKLEPSLVGNDDQNAAVNVGENQEKDCEEPLKVSKDDGEAVTVVGKEPEESSPEEAQIKADADKGVPEPTENEKNLDKDGDVEKKELDLDEDVKNPQYIPKKGVFYEHDDRSHDADDKKQSSSSVKKEEEVVESKESGGTKKAAVQEKQNENRRGNRRQRTDADRWNHDLFRDEKQKPKSKSELINAYGYDIRQERGGRNQTENRLQRGNNSTNAERLQGTQESQRSRQGKEGRTLRQNQPGNRSREGKPRRPNARNNRNDNVQASLSKRDGLSNRPIKSDIKDFGDDKQPTQTSSFSSNKREQETSRENKNTRNDSKGRRKTSRDRPSTNSVDDKLPQANTVMSPITIWSSEDMAKAEAFKESPSRPQQNISNNNQRGRSTDYWQQSQSNKGIYQDKSVKSSEDNRHQHYNSRGRYQDRGDDAHKPTQFMARNQYGERPNQHNHEWHRANNFSPYTKSNDYIVKTQTFENSRFSQANVNRSNNRDLREVINERRMHGQQNFQTKVQQGADQHMHQRGQIQNQHMHHQFVQPQHQHLMHQQQHLIQQQAPQHLLQQQQQQSSSQHQQQQQHQQPTGSQQQVQPQQQPSNETQQQPSQSVQQTTQQQQVQNQRQQPTSQAQQQQNQSRQNLVISMAESGHESNRLSTSAANANDLMNSRPIIKTDSYTGAGVAPHQQPSQPIPQHSQNHRSMGMSQQGPNPAGSHLVPSHLGAGGTQAQYYSPSSSSRDPAAAAAALATAYHGYIPSGHSVMDTTRYHMTSQQLSDHGYIASPGQTNVAAASVLHQQGMYTDAASAGGTVASSAYLAQAGSTLSPNTNIPVTGAGPPPLPPVSYLQHTQYPPPPYSNPYSQPQHNQAPQSSHGYPPYWSYI